MAQGCEGNRRLQTPAPWEHEDCNQLARYPPLREEAPEWEKGVSGGGGQVKLRKHLFIYSRLRSQNALVDVCEDRGTFPTSY